MKDKVRHYVKCFNCRQDYDALEAVFCSCLSVERTLVCPMCLNCFCKSSKMYKQTFWESAPQELWDRMIEVESSESKEETGDSFEDLRRPFVLIVEPDQHIQSLARRIVRGIGYSVIIAADGEKGLELAKRYSPDLILTAALMPKMDGREMCREIKECPNTSSIKVVVMTALYTQQKYRCEAFRMFHVDEYMSKPLTVADLQRVLQKHIPFNRDDLPEVPSAQDLGISRTDLDSQQM